MLTTTRHAIESRARAEAASNLDRLRSLSNDDHLETCYSGLEIEAAVAAGFDASTDEAAAVEAQNVYAAAFLTALHPLDTALMLRLSRILYPA